MNIYNLINKYLEKINEKIAKNEIFGKDLINLTSSKQINLFVIKNIHEAWNKNFIKNKLDYFNYEDPEVISSINILMNTLSNNIKLEPDVTRSVLYKAINDALSLVTNSHEFIKKDLLNAEDYSVQKLISKSKYYCYHKEVFDYLINKIQQSSKLKIKTTELFNYFDGIPTKENKILNEGISLVLLEQTVNSKSIYEINWKFPICFIVGNEVKGVSEELSQLATVHAEIPMRGVKQSLNVSVATGVAGYEFSRIYSSLRK